MSVEHYRVLVQQMTEDRAKDLGLTDVTKAFEVVVNNLIMTPYDLGVDEIEEGSTDGGGDGQVDAVYVLVNGHALTEEDMNNKAIPSKGPLEVEIIFIQSKYTDSFEENPLKSVRNTIRDLLDLSKDYNGQQFKEYNTAIQSKCSLARFAILSTTGRTATIKATLYYATKGDNANIHPSVIATGEKLNAELSAATTTKETSVVYISSRDIIEMSRRPQISVRELGFLEQLTHDGDSYTCLVSIESLMKFLTDDTGALIRPMFDANVRDFLGETDVNDAIFDTLQNLGKEDFWWFNNGITLVAEHIDHKGKSLALTEPLLVNGLQTSNVIHGFMSSPTVDTKAKDHVKSKRILVRIIKPTSETIRDAIIRATNSQTHIPKPYLRGMDQVHRNIADHFKQSGLYYERRKNQYRNQGLSRSAIVTLTEMAQSLVATLLFRGGDARGRPNSLLKSDSEYKSLFSESYPLASYQNIINTKRRIMAELIKQQPTRGSAFRNNVIWHILAYISASRFHTSKHAADQWANTVISDADLAAEVSKVVELFLSEGGDDKVAKSPGFQNQIKTQADLIRQPQPAQQHN